MEFPALSASMSNMGSSVGQFIMGNVPLLASRGQKDLVLSEHDFEDFGPLFALNDRIASELKEQDFSAEENEKYKLDPPRVITVGLTSAGKSSLMERIIGFSIFPVRDNVCTRRPFRVRSRNDPSVDKTELRFTYGVATASDKVFYLPDDIDAVRTVIEKEQDSAGEDVAFSDKEIHAEIVSRENSTFTFTDLPGVFLVSERKMGQDYSKSRELNESLKQQTLAMTKKYMSKPNTIVFLVINSADWMHGMNNDNLVAYLAEWLEAIRKDHGVPVYGVITKLDTQAKLSKNSPIRKILSGQLGKDHILQGLGVRKWIPMVSSPAILKLGIGQAAADQERAAVVECLKSSIPNHVLEQMPIGRVPLLKELKQALLVAISRTHGRMSNATVRRAPKPRGTSKSANGQASPPPSSPPSTPESDREAEGIFESLAEVDPRALIPFLKTSASHKVLALLDAYSTMSCIHPMWRNFDVLHQNILLRQETETKKGKVSVAEETLQQMLNLPALAQVVKAEGDFSIAEYERRSGQTLSPVSRRKVAKHFARVEVMGYIIRMSLISSVFPLVIRDVRDGLFRGVRFGDQVLDQSAAMLLRSKLVFDPVVEKRVFCLMDPSSEDLLRRQRLVDKREVLVKLAGDFQQTQAQHLKLITKCGQKPVRQPISK